LGLLSSSTGISTKAARFRVAAGDRQVVSFGTRRVHPALAPLVERGCYMAGFDGVSNVLGGKLLGVEPSGTMPHALVQVLGDQGWAWKLYDETMPKSVKRTALVDTFWDEKTEAIKAFETLGKDLWGVRLDTPASRRGSFRQIIEEVKWELSIRGGEAVKIFVSGRLSEEDIIQLKDIVDGFGVGTAVAYPPTIDFSAKIVEVAENGKTYLRAKRGGLGGRKDVHRSKGFKDTIVLHGKGAPPRGSKQMQRQVITKGKVVVDFEKIDSIRERVVRELREVAQSEPLLSWG
jgi:nicotinate phosphoribosyltransferase